jgi:hypothetical protein
VASREPPPGFARAALDLARVAPGDVFGRIYDPRFPDPLGYGKARSRFSDPRRRSPESRFGVLYLGSSLKVCFLEALLRDERDGLVGDYPMDERELDMRRFAQVVVREELTLLDLTGDAPVRMGVASDVPRSSKQALARRWSLAAYAHPAQVDGIRYPSRLNGELNLAIYDRAISKLAVAATTPLRDAPGLARVLNDLKVALI